MSHLSIAPWINSRHLFSFDEKSRYALSLHFELPLVDMVRVINLFQQVCGAATFEAQQKSIKELTSFSETSLEIAPASVIFSVARASCK